jgi:DNA-binding HxlR family transcriptional regulator
MNKEIEKLLFNPIRLKIISFLMTVEHGKFKALIEVTNATKGNLSIQLKKLNDKGLIKITKYFEKNYPKTECSITKKGSRSLEEFFSQLQSYKTFNKKK